MKKLVRRVLVAKPLEDVLVRMIFALSPGNPNAAELVKEYVRYGPGPRGAQAVLLMAKVFSLLDNRANLAFEDIQKVLLPALRHRLILNYQADAEGITADQIVQSVQKSA